MSRPAPASSRWTRVTHGWSIAAISTLLAATAHGLAGGGFPPTIALVLAVIFGGLVAMLLAGRRLSRPRLAAMVFISQGIFHGLFALFGVSGSSATDTAGAVAGGHHVAAVLVPSESLVDAVVTAHPDMWASHLIAAAVTYAVIRYGALVLAGLGIAARQLLAPLRIASIPRPVPLLDCVRRRIRESTVPRPRSRPFLVAWHHRGPPAGVLA